MIWEMSNRQSAANGGLMRTSVTGLFPKEVRTCAENICKLTHYDPRCVGSCVIVSELIHTLVYGIQTPTLFQIRSLAQLYDINICEYVDKAWIDSDVKNLVDYDHMGYTLVTLSVALWAYWHSTSFVDGLLAVVNAGGDADTNAAVACAILGAKYGYSSIPKEYIEGLLDKETLDKTIDSLLNICVK
ncbi:ADP-ribosylglycohydrolase family protein [uncultured Prevotella sp.]